MSSYLIGHSADFSCLNFFPHCKSFWGENKRKKTWAHKNPVFQIHTVNQLQTLREEAASSIVSRTWSSAPSIFFLIFCPFYIFAPIFTAVRSFGPAVWVTVWTALMMRSQFRLSNIGRLPQQCTGTSGCGSRVLTSWFLQIKIRKWSKVSTYGRLWD